MDTALINLYNFNKPLIEYLYHKGIISFGAKERLEIYAFYSELIKKGVNKMEAFFIVAEKYNKSEERVQGIIYKMNKNV